MRSRIIVVAAVIAVLAIGAYLFQQREQALALKYFEGSGTLEAAEVTLIAQTGGTVAKLSRQEGESVVKDQVIAEIDNPILGYQLDQAQAQVEAAKSVYDANASAVNKAQLAAAEAQLGMARAQAAYRQVVSPIKGTLISLPVNEGDTVAPGTVIAVIGDLTRIKLQVYVPEYQLGRVRVGSKVAVHVDSYPGRGFTGRLTEIASEPEFTPANVETKDQRVKLVFAATVELPNGDLKLKPGMPADIKLKVR